MRFALLGNHPDGVDMAYALVATGRHEIVAVASPSLDADHLAQLGNNVRRIGDLEEILADPAVDAVIVASGAAHRATHLRRALQAERHVLCVYPPDPSPDLAYEAAMIQHDTGHVLLPLLGESLHPGLLRLDSLRQSGEARLGRLTIIELEHHATDSVLQLAGEREDRPSVPGWHILRILGGEIAEVSAFTSAEVATPSAPLLTSGRFETGGLFRATFLPHQSRSNWRLIARGEQGQADLHFPLGNPGPAFLAWVDSDGETHEETWDPCSPWAALVPIFEKAAAQPNTASFSAAQPASGTLTWHDAVRGLELDAAARRAVERRRVSSMEYQEASEEVGFKGTMTLVGCSLIWVVLLLFIASLWMPQLRWVIIPVLVLFLALQLFRWIIPRRRNDNDSESKKPRFHRRAAEDDKKERKGEGETGRRAD